VRESHRAADGQIRLEDEPFDVGDAKLAAPRDPEGPPEETINCRCQMERMPIVALDGEERRRALDVLQQRCTALDEEIRRLDNSIETNTARMLAISEHLQELAEEQERFRERSRPSEIRGGFQTAIDLLRGILRSGGITRFLDAGISAVTALIDRLDRERHFLETSEIARTNRNLLERLSEETRSLSQDRMTKFRERQSLGCPS